MDELIEFLENFDFAYDVRADYASFREEMGLTATIRRLREEYSEPLEDPDDSQIFAGTGLCNGAKRRTERRCAPPCNEMPAE